MSTESTSHSGPTFVVGVDGTELSLDALRRTLDFARAVGGRIVVVFARFIQPVVADPLSGVSTALVVEDAVEELGAESKASAEAILAGSGLAWHFVARVGEPAHEIIEVAHEVGADWIVVGASIHGPISGFFLSSVASHLLHHSDVSVAIVRPPREGRESS